MSTELEFFFPFGRYHATSWDRAANDGSVEWPPAPWRILRALYACWANHELERTDGIAEEEMLGVLGKLAVPPTMVTAPVDEAHTRHYMPSASHRTTNRSAGTDRIIDSFAVVPAARGPKPRSALKVSWPVELSAPERDRLAAAAGSIGYLGRAESTCWAVLVDEMRAASAPAGLNHRGLAGERRWEARPAELSASPSDVSVMLDGAVADVDEASLLTPDIGSGFKPEHLLATVAKVRIADRRAMPVGSKFVRYWAKPAGGSRLRSRKPVTGDRVESLRWVLDPATRPSATLGLAYAELLRARSKKVLEGADDTRSDVHLIVGHRAGDEQPAHGHRHAHFLFLDEDRDGLIDHATLWVPDGLSPSSAAKLLKRVSGVGSDDGGPARRVNMRFLSAGPLQTVTPWLIGPSTVWATNTPFCVPRFQKRETTEQFVANAIERELASRGIDTSVVSISISGQRDTPDHRFPMRDLPVRFRRHRSKRRRGPQRDGHERGHFARNPFAVRVEFGSAVTGPLVLGHYSHFGLGVFFPADD
ncbi:MAG: type I-U CRISPR-associated protein Cas5/Cas6 [Acidimicrobiia bacterium]|nr:type I-U CRISPR-associated protein Cas5/Cas6 [Acidimicrobiia bacterium]